MPSMPKSKMLEDYVGSACQDLLRFPGSPSFLFVMSDTEADYRRLMQGQYFNHFQHNHELTTKSRLAANLADYQISSGCAVDSFFPRSYDLNSRQEREVFLLDYRRGAALRVASLVSSLPPCPGNS
eukprot:633009-Amphidinium_carterae.1